MRHNNTYLRPFLDLTGLESRIPDTDLWKTSVLHCDMIYTSFSLRKDSKTYGHYHGEIRRLGLRMSPNFTELTIMKLTVRKGVT